MPAPRAARALSDVIMCKRLANAMIERNGGCEGSSLCWCLMALVPCQRGPRRRVRTYCHPLRTTLHYGKLATIIVGATSDDGQITGVSEFMIIRAIRYVVGEQ